MPKKNPSGLTKTERGYCRTIGYYIHDGKRVPRKFRLGYDKTLAKRKVDALEGAWRSLPGERGDKYWTDEAVERALVIATPAVADMPAIMTAPVAVPVFPSRPVPPPQPIRSYTLLEALDEFANYFAARNDISEAHRTGTKCRIKSIKLHIEQIAVVNPDGSKSCMKDLPIAAMDMEWLARIRNKITSRPLTNRATETAKPITIDTVKNWLMALGMAFDWFDRTPRIGWVAPHSRWREHFVLGKKQEYALRTPEERDNEGRPKPAFTVDELLKIYKNSTPLGRKYLLMGLFLGWSQEGIKSFRRCHLVKINDEYYIDRRRGKTGISGLWWVCPELADILTQSIAQTPPNEDDLAFLTEGGQPFHPHDRILRQHDRHSQ